MPAFLKIPNPIRVDKLTEIIRIRGVSVYVHWTVFLVAAAMIAGAVEGPVLTLAASISYMGVMLIHECGHLVAAQRLGCRVSSIELYPIFGVTHFETPWSRFDHCVIAWGGVIAQAIVAFPVIIWTTVFGYTPFAPLNAVLAILGFFSLGIAAINLLPVEPLDGSIAWRLLPEFFKRLRNRPKSKAKAAGGWRP